MYDSNALKCHSRVSCRLDTYRFSDWDIGYVTGLTVYLGSRGWYPSWNLDYVSANLFGRRETWEKEPINTLDTKSNVIPCNQLMIIM